MGNGESSSREYTPDQLQQLSKGDDQLLQNLETEIAWNDKTLATSFLAELRNNGKQFEREDTKVKKKINRIKKRENVNFALESLNDTLQNISTFKEEEVKALLKEIERSSSLGLSSLSSLFEWKKSFSKDIHEALIRRDKRKKITSKLYLSMNEATTTAKADWIFNFFGKETHKIMDEILLNLNDLPSLHELSYFEEFEKKVQKSESSSSTPEQDTNENEPASEKAISAVFENGDSKTPTFEKNTVKKMLDAAFGDSMEELLHAQNQTPSVSKLYFTALTRLLGRIQRALLQRASLCTKPTGFAVSFLVEYTLYFLTLTKQLLQRALEVNKLLSKSTEKPTFHAQLNFILSLSPPLFLSQTLYFGLCLLTQKTGFQYLGRQFLLPLSEVVNLLDQICKLDDVAQKDESKVLEQIAKSSKIDNLIVVESPHVYFQNMEDEQFVQIPGATHLYIVFDPMCVTNRDDTLQLWKGQYKEEPLTDLISGASQQKWPATPLIIQGDNVLFEFKSSQFSVPRWGYRAIVVGLCLEANYNSVLYYQLRLSSWMLETVAKASLQVNLTEEEKKYELFLDSRVCRAGISASNKDPLPEIVLQERAFVDDFVNNKPGSFANALMRAIEQKVSPSPVDRMGGDVVSRTLRYYTVVILKHMGVLQSLTKMNAKQSGVTIDKDDVAVKIWLEARKLRQWIVAEKSKDQALNKSQDDKEKPQEITYEKICETIMEKLGAVLEFDVFIPPNFIPPTVGNLSKTSDEVMDEDMDEVENDEKPFVGSYSDISFKEMFGRWRKLQLSASQKVKKHNLEALKEVPLLVSAFIKSSDVSGKILKEFACSRKDRLDFRMSALSAILGYTETGSFISVRQQLVALIGPTLRSLKDKQNDGHYLNNVKSSGIGAEMNLKHLIVRLGSYLLKIAQDPNCNQNLRELAINALCIRFSAEDRLDDTTAGFLHQLMQGLHQLMITETKSTVFGMAFQYFCLQFSDNNGQESVLPSESPANTGKPMPKSPDEKAAKKPPKVGSSMDAIQTYILKILMEDLMKFQELYLTQQKQGKPTDSYFKTEAQLHGTLFLLKILSQSAFFIHFFKSSQKKFHEIVPFLKLLLSVFHTGSPRLQMLSLKIFREVFPLCPTDLTFGTNQPMDVDDEIFLVAENDFVTPEAVNSAEDIILLFLDFIGKSLFLAGEEQPKEPRKEVWTYESANYRNGLVNFAVASECIMILRNLLTQTASSSHKDELRSSRDTPIPLSASTLELQNFSRQNTSSWCEYLTTTLCNAVVKLEKLVNWSEGKIGKSLAPIPCRALAALAILGGHSEVLRPGTCVEIKSTKEKGFLCYCDRTTASAKIIMNNNPSVVIDCDLEQLRAVPEQEISLVPLKNNLKTLLKILIMFSKTKTDNQNIKLSTEILVAPIEPPSVWACKTCTYENDEFETRCLCGAAKPKVEKKESNTGFSLKKSEGTKPKPHSLDVQNILFYQFKSRALKAISFILQQDQNLLLQEDPQTLEYLLKLAVTPTNLDEFKSVEQLEVTEERIRELLFQYFHCLSEDFAVVQQQPSQLEFLKFSPFASLPITLPNSLSLSASKKVFFPASGNLCAVIKADLYNHFATAEENSVGIARAQIAVPHTLQSYYFEVAVSDYSADSKKGLLPELPITIAIGLYREGCELEGVPGNVNSYVYKNTGVVAHNDGIKSSRDAISKFGKPFGNGDVVGCGWNLRKGEIFFTLNGEYVGIAFQNVSGRFFPCVWVGISTRLDVNFGQEQFKFNFEATLSKDHIDFIKEAAETTSKMSREEIDRRTKAEELMMMMDIFPINLCILALEKCKDDLEYAANWLLEHGFKELDRITNETISMSEQQQLQKLQQEEEINFLGVALEKAESEEKEPEKMETVHEGAFSNSLLEDFESENDSREPARFLDDELGTAAPIEVQRERRDQTVTYTSSPALRIEEICLGAQLQVNLWDIPFKNFRLRSRTGYVCEIDYNGNRVKLKFVDLSLGSMKDFWFQLKHLRKPAVMWQDPCVDISSSHTNLEVLSSEAKNLCDALSIARIRRAIYELINQKPQVLSAPPVGLFLLEILKLAASENLSSGSDLTRNQGKSKILDTFQTIFTSFLTKDEGKKLLPLKLADKIMLSESSLRDIFDINCQDAVVTKILTEECITHFKRSTEAVPETILEESPHPYKNHTTIRKKFHFKGASQLVIRFDPKCNIHKTDSMTWVGFYRDEKYQDLINGFRGDQFAPLIVEGDRVWFRFNSGPGETFWGYKFTIQPMKVRLNDHQALEGLNFELGYWLLSLLLEKGPKLVRQNYVSDLYNALVFYIKGSKRAAKSRGLTLLLRILQEIRANPQHSGGLDTSPLLTMIPAMFQKYDLENKDKHLLFSAQLQSLCELMAISQLTNNKITSEVAFQQPNSSKMEVEHPEIEASMAVAVLNNKIRITSAIIHEQKNSKEKSLKASAKPSGTDVTKQFQEMVDKGFHGSHLILGAAKFLQKTPKSGEEISIVCQYQVEDSETNQKLLTSSKQINHTEWFSITPEDWFMDLCNVTDNMQNLLNSETNTFSADFLRKCALAYSLRTKSHLLFLGEETDTTLPLTQTLPFLYREFTVSFWLNLEQQDTAAPANQYGRIIFMKGQSHNLTESSFYLILNPDGKTLKFQVHSSLEENVICQSKEVTQKAWHHVACLFNGKNMKLYLDGKLQSEAKIRGKFRNIHCPLFLNKPPQMILKKGEPEFDGIKGKLRDFRVYYRPLAEQDIQRIFESTKIAYSPKISLLSAHQLQIFAEKVSLKECGQLVEYANIIASQQKETSAEDLLVENLTINEELLRRFPSLRNKKLSIEEMKFMLYIIKIFNEKLANVFLLIDFSRSHLPWTLAHSLTKLKEIIFMSTKTQLWNRIISSTNSNRYRASLKLNRPKAARAKERGDPDGKRSVFGQMFRQLHFQPPASLRKTGQIWSVEFLGEGGTDAGGLFRDSISQACSDLMSSHVPLFLPCPNARGSVGDNMEKFIPNTSAASSLHLSMFAFVGKMMGVAIRGKHFLNLDLPSIVWKQIVGSEISRYDLESIDSLSYKIFDQVNNATDEDAFEDLVFTVSSTSGKEVELIPGGSQRKVTKENKHEFTQMFEQYKLNEFTAQVEAIKSGLATIVPIQLLSLFSWQELELSVCGKREMDIAFLKENTQYSGFVATDKTVTMFWEVLETFSAKERELFLRFVWGRSRLPLTSEDFDQKFVLMTCPKNTDSALPMSHTCFNQLEMPRYSSNDVMRKKLLYAILECRAIDTDFTAASNINWEQEEEDEQNQDPENENDQQEVEQEDDDQGIGLFD